MGGCVVLGGWLFYSSSSLTTRVYIGQELEKSGIIKLWYATGLPQLFFTPHSDTNIGHAGTQLKTL